MIVRVCQCTRAPGQGILGAGLTQKQVKVVVEILSAASATYRLFPLVQRVITRCSFCLITRLDYVVCVFCLC